MKGAALGAFAPLEPSELALASTPALSEILVPVTPVPVDASEPGFRHGRFGEPSFVWTYKDACGRVLGYVARFDTHEGKQILPRTWCRASDGTSRWAWKALEAPRPLYGLDRVAEAPAAVVLVVEGEKAADAAQRHFPELVPTTWPGGARAAHRADWSPLRDRDLIFWPDADEAGAAAVHDAVAAAKSAGAASTVIIGLPHSLPVGWDLADPIPAGMDVVELLATARPVEEPRLPRGYAFTSRGLVWRDPEADDKPEEVLSDSFQIAAETRDLDGTSWGVLLRWRDHDARPHTLALPRAALAGDGADARRMLLDGGLYVTPSRRGRERFTAFLTAVRSPARVTATNRLGWHEGTFVLPDRCIGANGEKLMLQGSGSTEHAFRRQGSLADWQREVARYAAGNSRLVLAISAAFAAALVSPCGAESGGIHLRGQSSTGKSTALLVAGSVWGGGPNGGYVRSWRATANGLEGVAAGHCDALLCLDELAQIATREAGEVAYLLANGAGKSRSSRDGAARRPARWRVLFLSSGDIGLADKVMEDGRKRVAAGQHVRIVDLVADAGVGLGLFETLHQFSSANELARHLRKVAGTYYGTAAAAFLEAIASDLDAVRRAVAEGTADFVGRHVPDGADGQVHRVAQRFALIGAAGELAVEAGVLGWPAGESFAAAARCFADWLDARGGSEPAEVRESIDQVRSFLLRHGMSRFVPAWGAGADQRLPVRDLAGFRKRNGESWDYFVTAPTWSQEVCAGLCPRTVASILADRRMLLVPNTGPHRAKSESIPGYGKIRVYHLSASFLEDERHG
jgi:uncharacterized protein (DUF927 family)